MVGGAPVSFRSGRPRVSYLRVSRPESSLASGDQVASAGLTGLAGNLMFPATRTIHGPGSGQAQDKTMKVKNSLKTAKLREKGCRVVRRHGRVYVINKKNPRFKARQG